MEQPLEKNAEARPGGAMRAGAAKEALGEQRRLIEDSRANLEIARGVNERAAQLQQRARRALGLLLPLIVVLIAYVSWLLFFKVRV
jgi:hypothetical protein